MSETGLRLRGVWDAWQNRRELVDADAALLAVPAALPDPTLIPPREWLYGTRLIRRFVSVMVAPGGVGKSALALGQAVAVATGRGFLGERVHHSVPAWVLNLEDPLDELHRRLAALMQRHVIPRETLEGRLFLHSGRTRRVSMAEAGADGGVVHPDREAIVAAALAAGIGLIVVDPFVKSHRLEENSNADMDAAATAWAEVAERAGAAVLLVHHVRKGGEAARRGAGPDVEAARGAKSLTDAARSASVLAPMSAEEAERLGVADGERWRHVRLDDAKANLAPQSGRDAERALWYRLETVALGNATAAYPAGDHVAAIAAWHPPTAAMPAVGTTMPAVGTTMPAVGTTMPAVGTTMPAVGTTMPAVGTTMPAVGTTLAAAGTTLDPDRAAQALALIGAGPGRGLAYSAHRGRPGRGDRWAGRVLVDRFGLTEAAATGLVGAWLAAGRLAEARYRDPVQRKSRLGVRLVDAHPVDAPLVDAPHPTPVSPQPDCKDHS